MLLNLDALDQHAMHHISQPLASFPNLSINANGHMNS